MLSKNSGNIDVDVGSKRGFQEIRRIALTRADASIGMSSFCESLGGTEGGRASVPWCLMQMDVGTAGGYL
ncbi:hypothetical protein PAXRUDRAFT_391237 [Paxillus rubicundulus Ve08.2h10]|uniref:Uncharacterized protein n=1 Tax=Paxillus rubicundulus Ve08.2h10 TaxID=930991 RepID=A0A0D0CPH3_9AGAM|nr:hypothetical protein PAXRUDRAFT_391237 [Paxillus rubicundulus Ve08.2h10]